MPALPPKSLASKMQSKDSEEAIMRKEGLDRFLKMLMEHPIYSSSQRLFDFLTVENGVGAHTLESEAHKVEGKFSLKYLLDCSEVFVEEQAIDSGSGGVTSGVSSIF